MEQNSRNTSYTQNTDSVVGNSAAHKLKSYLRFWPLFLISILLALTAAFIYIKYSTPQYSITSTILIHDDKNENKQVKNEQFADPNTLADNKNIENEILVLKSSTLMDRVIKELSLNTEYFIKRKFNDIEIYKKNIPFLVEVLEVKKTAFKKNIIIEQKDNNIFWLTEDELPAEKYMYGTVIKKSYATFVVKKLSGDDKIDQKSIILKFKDSSKLTETYLQRLSVSAANKQASILSLNFIDAIPERGEDIVNKLIEVYNKQASEEKNASAEKNIAFINQRLNSLSGELSNVEKGVEKFKQDNDVANINSQINQSLMDVSEYNKQIATYSAQIATLESIEKYVDQSGKMVPGTIDIQDPVLSELITKYNTLLVDRERLLRTAQENNPIVQSRNSEITSLQENIKESIQNSKNNLERTKGTLVTKVGQYGSKVLQVPSIERGLQKINRQESIKRELYLYLLQKREEASLMLSASIKNAQIIDSAVSSEYPISPQKLPVLAIAIMFGLGIPFSVVYLKDFFNNDIRSLNDIKWSTNIPVIGEIPHNNSKEHIVVTRKNRTPITEVFKLVRSNIQFLLAHDKNKVILITSSMSGEGKSFISLNLSSSFAIANKRVILINFDLRKNDSLINTTTKGISDYLQTDIDIKSIILESETIKNLYIISAGDLPDDPAELMLSPKLDILFDYLKSQYEYIIIDSAPIGQVADAFVFNKHINSTIYIIRYNKTQKAQLNIVNKLNNENKLNNISLLINDTKKNNSYGYGYGYGYGYAADKQHIA